LKRSGLELCFTFPLHVSSSLLPKNCGFLRENGKGRLTKRADAEKMADFCIATIQGAMLMGKIKRSSRTVETTSQEALTHLKGYVVSGKKLRKRPSV